MIRFFSQFLFAITLSALLGMSLSENEPGESTGFATSPYPDHVPGAYTGGFGEQTCYSCHFSYDVNDPAGSLKVEGLNGAYEPGEAYDITVSVQHEDIGIGGFQMTARFEDGSQAGTFDWPDDRITETPQTSETIQYIQHSVSGTSSTSEDTVSWSFVWNAPENHTGPVFFNIAANAANDDFSEFGDRIYVKEITLTSDQ